MRSTKTNYDAQAGYKRGLLAVNAKPATTAHAQIYNRIRMLADSHGQQISAGGNEERLSAIQAERLKMEREKIRNLNQHLAQEAASRYQSYSDKLRQRYESNPTLRLAHIMDASARFDALDKGAVNAMANEFLAGTREPASEYELLETIKRLPKHEIVKEYARRDDYALWTREGKEYHQEMTRYATMGDKMPFTNDDGDLITADVNDLYMPTQYSPREIAEQSHTA